MDSSLRTLRRISQSARSRTIPAMGTKACDMGEKTERKSKKEATRTTINALTFALRTLSSVSNGVPAINILSGIIDPLLDITARIKQTSSNAHALAQLAARIERLTEIVTQMARDDPDNKGQAMVRNLQRALVSMTADLEVANSRGKLNKFFNTFDNAAILQKHNAALTQMIADSMLVTVQEVAKSLRDLEIARERDVNSDAGNLPTLQHQNSMLSQASSSPTAIAETVEMESPTTLNDIAGGFGGMGGQGYIGGDGGEGEGPQLQLDIDLDERLQIGKVSGGTGGNGGSGVERGGKGGTGRGPVIVLRRTKTLVAAAKVESPTQELVKPSMPWEPSSK